MSDSLRRLRILLGNPFLIRTSEGINPIDTQRLGWVDGALNKPGHKRRMTVFTRHYQAAMLMAEKNDRFVTIPAQVVELQTFNS